MYIYIGNSPHVYSNLPYDVHTVTVQALSDSLSVTIVQKGKYYIVSTALLLLLLFIVLMVMGEIGIINGTAIILHMQSALPATYRCRLNDKEYFSCTVYSCVFFIIVQRLYR